MRSRERVQISLDHQEPDRCPFSVGFTPEFSARLRADLEEQGRLPSGRVVPYDLERAMNVDMLLTFVGWANCYYQEGENYTDEWGVSWQSVDHTTDYGTGRYTEPVGHPLKDDRALEMYQPPNPKRPELYFDARNVIRQFKDDYWIVGAVVCTIFETAWALRGLERTFEDFVQNRELLKEILDIPYQYHLVAAKKLVELGVDMIWLGDDMGGQEYMLISPQDWRHFFKPLMANFICELKNINPDVKVAYHSDGNIYPIIPDLIEIGLDVLNPLQPASMDPARLKEEFGDQLCFWGSLDIQHTLPYGTPQDVNNEVLERLRTVGKGGGFIIGPSHYVQIDTPMENFYAMVETVHNTPYQKI